MAGISLNGRKLTKCLLDTACTRHVVNCRKCYQEFVPVQPQIEVENAEILISNAIITVDTISVVIGIRMKVTLLEILHVPDLLYNLFSFSRA